MNFVPDSSTYITLWLILVVAFVVIELATVGLFTIWFAAGALAAVLFAALKSPFWLQITVFLAVSIILLILTRPLAKRYVNGKAPKTNADRYVGQKAIVTEQVNNIMHTGRAEVQGMDWSIASENDTDIIEQGSLVEVLRISGSKLIVKQYKEE